MRFRTALTKNKRLQHLLLLLLCIEARLFLQSQEPTRVIKILDEQPIHQFAVETTPSSEISGGSLDENIMIIGAGLGTTGTHLIFEATCHMGFPSVHWNLGCLPQNDNSEISQHYAKHENLRKVISAMKVCIHNRQKCGSALRWKSTVMNMMNQFVEDGSIQAIHDTPYALVVPHLLRAADRFNKTAFVILSERDPEEYARRRLSLGHGKSDPICKNPGPTDLENLSGGGFDLIGCINHAAAQSDKPGELDLVDVFISFTNLVRSTGRRNGEKAIANATRIHQDMMRTKAAFSYNMFQQDNRTQVETLVAAIQTKVPALQSSQKPARFVNHWRNTELGDKLP
jgi:hypothetical protein